MAVPTNFKLSANQDTHTLSWDYDKKKYDKALSGFNIYREYYCPGSPTAIDWPHVSPNYARRADFPMSKMPKGCTCSYQISAFGQGGESARAGLPTGTECLTFEAKDDVQVTFKSVEIDQATLPNSKNVDIYVWANYFKANTAKKVNLSAGISRLLNMNVGNPMMVGIGDKQSLQLGFYISDTCKSKDLIFKEPANGWANVDADYEIAGGGCKMTVHVGKGAGGAANPNPLAPPVQQPADPGIQQKIQSGQNAVIFTNLSKTRTIIGLDIYLKSDPNNSFDFITDLNFSFR